MNLKKREPYESTVEWGGGLRIKASARFWIRIISIPWVPDASYKSEIVAIREGGGDEPPRAQCHT